MAVYTSMHRQIKDVCLCRSEFSFWVCGSHHVGRCDTTGTKRDHEEPSSTAGTTKDRGNQSNRATKVKMDHNEPRATKEEPKGTKRNQERPNGTKSDQKGPTGTK